MRTGSTGKEYPCYCVFRAIFRACYARFRECVMKEKHLSRISFETCQKGRDHKFVHSRKTEDYIADFCQVSRRGLDDLDYKIFCMHFLLGADWRLCCRRMGVDRGAFFHAVYRIQETLGRLFRELEPYGLFPVDEYFGGTIVKERDLPPLKVKMMPVRRARPVEVPIRKSA